MEKFTINGKQYPTKDLQFNIKNEDWNEYELLDGGKIRVKTVVMRIMSVVDENGVQVKNPDGSPAFAIQSNTMVVASQ